VPFLNTASGFHSSHARPQPVDPLVPGKTLGQLVQSARIPQNTPGLCGSLTSLTSSDTQNPSHSKLPDARKSSTRHGLYVG
jgi:hypothetical protein